RAPLPDGALLVDAYVQDTAGHGGRDLLAWVEQAESTTGGNDGASRRAGGLGLAGATLPDQQLHARAAGGSGQLHIGAVREGGMVLHQWSQVVQLGYVKSGPQENAVGIAQRQRDNGKPLAVELQLRQLLAK